MTFVGKDKGCAPGYALSPLRGWYALSPLRGWFPPD